MSRTLARAVERTLPDPPATLLLQAALWDGDAGRAALHRWVAEVGDPRDLPDARRQPVRELAPQLDVARERHGVAVPGALGVLLHAAADHERRRWAPYRAGLVDLLIDQSEPLVSGGLATALAAHPEPALRHCHDVDVLGAGPAQVTHPSGLPAARHRGRWPAEWGPEDLAPLRARAVADDRPGRTVLRASVGDLLVVVLVHAVAGRRPRSVRWASDAWLLAAAADVEDWEVFVATVEAHQLAPVVLPPLRYVAGDLRGAVPAEVPAALAAAPPPEPRRADLARRWADRRSGHRSMLRTTATRAAERVGLRR